MAEINFGILDTQAPGRIAALPQQLQEQQAQNATRLMQFKNTVQQNALAQAKIDEYKRDLAEKDVLRKLMTRPGFDIYDPKYQAEAMAVSPTYASPLIKHALEVRKTESETNKNIAQTKDARIKTALNTQSFLDQARRNLAVNPSDDNIKAWAQDSVIQNIFTPEQAAQIQANLLKVPLAQRQAMFASAGAPARQPSSMAQTIAEYNALPPGHPDRGPYENFFNLQRAGAIAQDSVTGNWYNKATNEVITPPSAAPAGQPGTAPLVPGIAPAGQPVVTPTARPPLDMMQSPAFQELVRRGVVSTPQEAAALAQAMSLDAAGKPVNITVPNALAGAPVNALAGAAPTGASIPRNPAEAKIAFTQQQQALYEPIQVIDESGKTIYVSKAEAIRRGMTPAEKSTDLTPKQVQQLELKFPQATNAVKTFESKAESLEKDLKRLAEHPGLSGISGLIYGRTPALTKDARAAEALYNSVIARGGFNELQSLRSASPTGGALGNVSDQENQYLRDAFAPLKLTQDTADLKKALLDAANSVAGSRQRIRETYDMTYEYRKNRGGDTSAPASGGVDTNNPLLRRKD